MVAKPCVDYLLRDANNVLTVSQYLNSPLCQSVFSRPGHAHRFVSACRTLSTAAKLVAGRQRATAIALDVTSPDLDSHIACHDLVISLVPFIYHADIIQSAIKGKTNVVTTS
jgi:saccharopine dehydrogenase (NADP+, L-glutamate forming)